MEEADMSQAVKQPGDIYQELLNLPDDITGEIINGELHTQPRPAPRHALASSSLGGELDGPYFKGRGGPGGWWIIDETEIHLADDVLVPDIAGWKKERMPKLPETAFFDVSPDWVCEVYQLETQYWKLIGTFSENDHVSISPFQEISIDLSFLWGE